MMYDRNSLAHYGIIGMKWGIRRYQNKDGSLTKAGQDHYQSGKQLRYLAKRDKAIAKGNANKAKKYDEKFKRQATIDRYVEQEYNRTTKGLTGLSKVLTNLDRTTSKSYLEDVAKVRAKNHGGLPLGKHLAVISKHGTIAGVQAGLISAGAFFVKSGLAKRYGQKVFSEILESAKAKKAAREAAQFIPKIANNIVSYVADASEYVVKDV